MVFIIIFLMSALVAWKMTDIGAGLIALIAAIVLYCLQEIMKNPMRTYTKVK